MGELRLGEGGIVGRKFETHLNGQLFFSLFFFILFLKMIINQCFMSVHSKVILDKFLK